MLNLKFIIKVIIYVLFYMLSAKIVYSHCFYLNLIFDKIQDGDHVW